MGLTVNQMLRAREVLNETPTVSDIREIIIDGNIIKGYNVYKFFYEKTYSTEPTRSLGGVIAGLNTYATFITPKIKINFKALSLSMYRIIMQLILQKNEFTVQCWDYVYNTSRTFKMYFYPQDYTEIFQYEYSVLAVMDYEIELIGTNETLDTVSITYHSNPPDGSGDATIGVSGIAVGTEKIIGQNVVYQDETYSGHYKFKNWTAAQDGSGFAYTDGEAYTIVSDIVLYAQWIASSDYVLSYDYGAGETYLVNGYPLTNKSIASTDTYGTLPTTSCAGVAYNETLYYPYENPQWYKTPTIASNSVPVTSSTVYGLSANSTIYQVFTPITYTITMSTDGGLDYNTVQYKYGAPLSLPTPRKSGSTFSGWYWDSAYTTEFTDETMPPLSITIYAKYS